MERIVETGDLRDSGKHFSVEGLDDFRSAVLKVFLAEQDLSSVDTLGIALELDLTVLAADDNGVSDVFHVLDHLLELVTGDEDGLIVAGGKVDINVLDVLDLDGGAGETVLLLGTISMPRSWGAPSSI